MTCQIWRHKSHGKSWRWRIVLWKMEWVCSYVLIRLQRRRVATACIATSRVQRSMQWRQKGLDTDHSLRSWKFIFLVCLCPSLTFFFFFFLYHVISLSHSFSELSFILVFIIFKTHLWISWKPIFIYCSLISNFATCAMLICDWPCQICHFDGLLLTEVN